MSTTTSIEWTGATWNPVTGCTEVSPGCDHCYARVFAERFRGVPHHPYTQGFDVTLWPERLTLPQRWKRGRLIFVNSMSDLFHKDVPDAFILDVCDAMMQAPQHIYQVLTKRPSRLVNTSLLPQILERVGGSWPAHIWLGVSVENQDYAWRVDALRRVPAPTRFISAEPLLGPLTLDLSGIAQVITGAESGHGARPMDDAWVRSLRDQCQVAGVNFFFKQRVDARGHKQPLPELDGLVWSQIPCIPGRGLLFTLGYAAPGAQERLEDLMRDPKALLLDIRCNPYSRYAWRWNRPRLEARWGMRYRRIPELGNEHYRIPGSIRLALPDVGIPLIVDLLAQGFHVILLCACKNYETCHRKVVVDLVQQALPTVPLLPDVPKDRRDPRAPRPQRNEPPLSTNV